MNQLIQKLDLTSLEQQAQTYLDKNIAPLIGIQSSIRRVLLGLGLVSSVTYLFSKYILYRLFLNKVNKIPGPPVEWTPFTGNMREIIREEAGVPHKKWAKLYGGILSYKGPWYENRILVTDPELVKQVLTTNSYDYIKPPRTQDFLKRILGDGLLVSEGDAHRKQRKMLNPAFSVQALRYMIPLMVAPGVQLRNKWMEIIAQDKKNGNTNGPTEIIVSSGLSLATLDVIGSAGMGQNFDSLQTYNTPSENKLSKAYLDIFKADTSLFRVLTFFFPILRHVPTERNKMLNQDLKWLDEESRRLVEVGMDRVDQDKKKHQNISNDQGSRQVKDLLTLMVDEVDEAGHSMTVKELQNQCLTFLAAGHETTSVALSWCLWLLAKHPEIQDALREEIKPVFGQIDTEHAIFADPLANNQFAYANEANIPSYDTINSLPLLNNVCKETLRLIPPVPLTLRIATKDSVMNHYVVPKDTIVALSPIVSHHSTDIWGDDALEFRPSRWDEPLAKNVSPYEYYPFLAGSRQCIGNRFAMVEMKILLALLIMDLKYTEKPGFEFIKKQSITLRPHPNMTLLVETV
ncbi:cytochrome P450 [Halteromyces radiatus]|uniref:cytochrome P450 n=1 Tax=Halteromyces radiatus TaxID=101107 RepID=UPI00221FD638|nr:cytochrome P450 [Halteromyces radiatus]KAI8089521.1 cytochrome P450 [Halteromyces radiatus]